MKLKCSCGGVAYSTRRKTVYQGEVDYCAACGQPGHIAITDDYQDNAVANWHLTSECSGGERCSSIHPEKSAPPLAGEPSKEKP